MKKILVLCTGNSCRSQMAEAYLRYYAKDKAIMYSAGIEAHGINPFARLVLAEEGISIDNQTSNKMDEYTSIIFDYIITVCDNAKEYCPVLPGSGQTFHKSFKDPAKATGTEIDKLNQFREVRDEIKKYCAEFVGTHLEVI